MKMNSVNMPKVLEYYISTNYRDLLSDKFLSGHCEIIEKELYLIIDYDPDLYTCLRLYLEKIKTNEDGKFVYEEELAKESFSGDQDFIIYLEDGAHVCKLVDSNLDNQNIILIFSL